MSSPKNNIDHDELARQSSAKSTHINKLARLIHHYEDALRRIADPISWMRDQAEAKGHQFNGAFAIQIATPHYLGDIAREALKKSEEVWPKICPICGGEWLNEWDYHCPHAEGYHAKHEKE